MLPNLGQNSFDAISESMCSKQTDSDWASSMWNECVLCKQWVLFPGKGLLTKDTNKFEFEFNYGLEIQQIGVN